MKRTIAKVVRTAKARPNETKWSLAGLFIGAGLGFMIGGIGIAAKGTAFGVPAVVILGLLGGMIGNRIGVGKDRPANN